MRFDTQMEQTVCVILAVLFGLVLRAGVGVHPYSGMTQDPMFGDYEAQRHWMEVTINLPLHSWYWNTSDNDLLYWGLDYPPLTAYHSWVMGRVARFINSSWVQLGKSRGIESPEHKQFMRLSALTTDALTFIPACLLYFLWGLPYVLTHKEIVFSPFWAMFLMLIHPGLCLIDHGHFQYNGASLGFFIASVAFLLRDYDILGSVFFCLALLYKQMELYHALPIFFYLLGKCISCSTIVKTLLKLSTLGVTVLITFGLTLFPFMVKSTDPVGQIYQIIHRIFPVARGLYEDKVSNVWCSLSVLIKWQQFITPTSQLILCGTTTLAASLPACLILLSTSTELRKRKIQLLYTLAISSLAFFLFSFQVHEKSILLAAIPVSLFSPLLPYMSIIFGLTSTLSMWPLLAKDQLALATVVLCCWFGMVGLSLIKQVSRQQWILLTVVTTSYSILGALHTFTTPPTKLPFLYPLLLSMFSCFQFLCFISFFYFKLFRTNNLIASIKTRRKKLK